VATQKIIRFFTLLDDSKINHVFLADFLKKTYSFSTTEQEAHNESEEQDHLR